MSVCYRGLPCHPRERNFTRWISIVVMCSYHVFSYPSLQKRNLQLPSLTGPFKGLPTSSPVDGIYSSKIISICGSFCFTGQRNSGIPFVALNTVLYSQDSFAEQKSAQRAHADYNRKQSSQLVILIVLLPCFRNQPGHVSFFQDLSASISPEILLINIFSKF